MDDSSSLFLLLIVFFVLVYEFSDVLFAFWMLICVRQPLYCLMVHSLHMHGPRHHPRVQILVGHVCRRRSVFELVHRSFQTGWDERRRSVGNGLQELQVSINYAQTNNGDAGGRLKNTGSPVITGVRVPDSLV